MPAFVGCWICFLHSCKDHCALLWRVGPGHHLPLSFRWDQSSAQCRADQSPFLGLGCGLQMVRPTDRGSRLPGQPCVSVTVSSPCPFRCFCSWCKVLLLLRVHVLPVLCSVLEGLLPQSRVLCPAPSPLPCPVLQMSPALVSLCCLLAGSVQALSTPTPLLVAWTLLPSRTGAVVGLVLPVCRLWAYPPSFPPT